MADKPADEQFVREQSTSEEVEDGGHKIFSGELSDEEKTAAEDAGFVFSEAEQKEKEDPPQPAEPVQIESPDQPQPDLNQGEGGEQVV